MSYDDSRTTSKNAQRCSRSVQLDIYYPVVFHSRNPNFEEDFVLFSVRGSALYCANNVGQLLSVYCVICSAVWKTRWPNSQCTRIGAEQSRLEPC